MEITQCFLLLLICSLSTVQLQPLSDNEVIPGGKKAEVQRQEPADDSNQQLTRSHIHAVLRVLSATLAELRLKIRFLQTDSEAQEAKQKELKSEVDKLKQQLQAQAAELITLKRRSNITENKVEALQKNEEVKQVTFSVSLSASGSVTIGPFNTFTPLVFKHVVSNIGNAYNPDSGFFIAPVRGAYHFDFYIGGNGHASRASGAVLVKNGHSVFTAWTHQTSGYLKAGNGVNLLLEVGDVVCLNLYANSWVFDNESHQCTFSGHLLFTM